MSEILNKLDYWSDRITDRMMRWLPAQLIQVPVAKPIVSFTFDDVPDTALTNGARILEHHGVRGTFYIAGSLEGRREPGRTLISREGCQSLAEQGHEIGCHTFSHTKVSHMGTRTLEADLQQNKGYLDAIEMQDKKRNFAYPYNAGSFWARRVFANRFQTCRAGGERINRGAVNPVFLSGVEIRQPEAHAQGLTAWIDTLVAEPGWLIFFTHDIAPQPTEFGCTADTFEKLVSYSLAQGCSVLPVRDALAEFGAERL
ncbi:polysaccharide deacetylase family protein [Phyllobacterium sp. 628]|uniref:polysaccharide deacetylase family protein n=1 Tax=Phyllobacterium sp. 628 TaxID=2718938 RepID=UPI0016628681|nr:polysaccharide deacetylase family protein [Phyllobacterium sp. 628]QND50827.1 polysaccharide deacetylase family protein [Phyllobacterium sp. 628]